MVCEYTARKESRGLRLVVVVPYRAAGALEDGVGRPVPFIAPRVGPRRRPIAPGAPRAAAHHGRRHVLARGAPCLARGAVGAGRHVRGEGGGRLDRRGKVVSYGSLRHLAYASPLVRPEHRMQAIPEPSLTEPAGHAVHMAAGVDLPQHVCVCMVRGKDAPTGCRAVGSAHSPVGDRPAAAPAAAPGRPAVAGVRPVVAGRRPAAAGGRRVRATAAAAGGGPTAARRDLVPRLARGTHALPVAGACEEGEKGRVRKTGNAV